MKIWIDLDNTPHVPFFIPIIRELERRSHRVVLTARDAFQVCELADEKGLRYLKIGHHYGKRPVMKVLGLFLRSGQMLRFCLRQRPGLALSHGSRSQILLSNILRIPTVLIMDYEHTRTIPLARPRWLITPESLSDKWPLSIKSRTRYYRGIKEEVYAAEFHPDISILRELGLSQNEMIITIRPPADEAHYYNPESDALLNALMARVSQTPEIRVVLLPRNLHQEQAIRVNHPDWFADARTIIPPRALDGLNLIWHSDLVVSGGGTMNREAAALGVPVYSIFRGKTGAVDHMLEQEGRLIIVQSVEEVWSKIRLLHRDKSQLPSLHPLAALLDIIDHIEDIVRIEQGRPLGRS